MDNKDIDKLFRDRRHDMDKNPSDAAWDRLARRLDEADEAGEIAVAKKSGSGWIRYMVAAMLTVTLIASFLLFNRNLNPATESGDMAVQSSKSTVEERIIANKNQQNKTDQSSSKKLAPVTDSMQSAPDVEHLIVKENSEKEDENLTYSFSITLQDANGTNSSSPVIPSVEKELEAKRNAKPVKAAIPPPPPPANISVPEESIAEAIIEEVEEEDEPTFEYEKEQIAETEDFSAITEADLKSNTNLNMVNASELSDEAFSEENIDKAAEFSKLEINDSYISNVASDEEEDDGDFGSGYREDLRSQEIKDYAMKSPTSAKTVESKSLQTETMVLEEVVTSSKKKRKKKNKGLFKSGKSAATTAESAEQILVIPSSPASKDAEVISPSPVLDEVITTNSRVYADYDVKAADGQNNLGWLKGNWQSNSNFSKARLKEIDSLIIQGEQFYIPLSDTIYIQSYTIETTASGFVLRTIDNRNATQNYQMIENSSDRIIFENEDIDYPKQIILQQKTGNQIENQFRGIQNGNEVESNFEFEKIDD